MSVNVSVAEDHLTSPSSSSLREIMEEMRHLALVEGRVYSCIHDTRIRDDSDQTRGVRSVVEAGTVVVAVRTPDGDEAVLIDGVVVPFDWVSNCYSLLFEPIDL